MTVTALTVATTVAAATEVVISLAISLSLVWFQGTFLACQLES